jgi:hypothetical protein
MNKLTEVTIAQRRRIAALAGTSDAVVRHIQSGARQASSTMAIKIERAAKRIGLDVPRESLCAACGGCDLARKARKT